MGLDALEGAVLAAAQAQADAILEEARNAAASRLHAAIAARRAELEAQLQRDTQELVQSYAGHLAHARGELNRELLGLRNAILNRVFDRARLVILEMPPRAYRTAMKHLLDGVAPGRDGMIRIHPEDEDLFERILSELNADREEQERLRVDMARSLDTRGGFVYDSGTFEVDRTLSSVLEELRGVLSPVIAARIRAAERAATLVHTPST
jgi:vacuolar-type H+-ATPase subunit E/Vma4